MKTSHFLLTSALSLIAASPVAAQTIAPSQDSAAGSSAQETAPESGIGDIVVTAQRQSQRLQDVPISVSAFTGANLEKQQIQNPTQLQATLPNVTFTKTNYTSSSFTIRGIGDLCVGFTCDSATAIHVNDMPLLGTRLFEAEYFDLERIEVLRGPQGTLFGRNATSGVVNFLSAKPDMSGIHTAGEVEYANYDSKRVKGMVNLPITDTLGVRVAGTYLNRDGYTYNQYDNSRIDDRDLYSLRGTLSWEPNSDTRIDLIGYYFHERDNRSRIQKQLCHRDTSGILGCAPDKLTNETTNGNATLGTLVSSREFLGLLSGGALTDFGLASLYDTDTFAGVANPAGVRTVRIDTTPTYFAKEEQYTVKFFHNFGPISLNFTGGYMGNTVDARSDYTLAVNAPYTNNPGLMTLAAAASLPGSPFAGVRNTLIPNGPNGGLCQSDTTPNAGGVFSGASVGCFAQSLDFDRSTAKVRQYSGEAHIDSAFDGMFNFLLGGIYFDSKTTNGDYYVSGFGLDYASGILGAASSAGIPGVAGRALLGTPFYRNSNDLFRLKSYGIFGESYFDLGSRAKLTVGLRYNHDNKFVRARTTFLQDSAGTGPLLAYGATSLSQAFNASQLDYDASLAGLQPFAESEISFSKLTGRAVFDYKITPRNMVYASYSRGYKSGGINPPLSPSSAVPSTFAPESVDAFEIGSKNTFGNGTLRLNVTGFYYKYKKLQLSRIIARTSVNDNVDANIYGVEAEAIINPVPALVVNLNFSYLKTKVSGDRFIANPRDPSGGRSDAVIIKDLTNGLNCAIVPTKSGNAAGANGFVSAVNSAIGLRAPTAVTGTGTTGAYSVCSVLASVAADPPSALRSLFGVPTGALPFTMLGSGVEVNLRGNQLPQAPTFKWAAGIEYTYDVGSSGWTIVPRADIAYTGKSYGTIFNRTIDRIPGYEVVNAQLQINGPEDRFYLRAFVRNLTKNDATTGMFVTDQSSGLFTNIFTIEPRSYGIAAGFKF
ncbi:MAG TPA: TonB-dependent receptor [Sphingobium sp.]